MNRLAGLVLVLLLAGAGVFYALRDRTYTLTFTEPQLRERIGAQLPFTETYLQLFEVTLDNPRVDLIDGADRVAGGLDAALKVRFGAREFDFSGAVDVSGGVRYAAEEGAFYMTDPEIENVAIAGVPAQFSNRANNALSLALTQFYAERPIYHLDTDDVKHAAAKLVLRDVRISNERLHVTLGFSRDARKAKPDNE